MHFLHTDARLASEGICEQETASYLESCVLNLRNMHSVKPKGLLVKWLEEDGFNYHWLGYFCECLQHRVDSLRYFAEIKNLRICVPPYLKCTKQTPFPRLLPLKQSNDPIADYRLDYVLTRYKYATWNKTDTPAWFARLAHSVLPPGESADFFSRVQSAGPSRADDPASRCTERKDVRDGPVANSIEPTGEHVTLWG